MPLPGPLPEGTIQLFVVAGVQLQVLLEAVTEKLPLPPAAPKEALAGDKV